jgi:hypothetical protein
MFAFYRTTVNSVEFLALWERMLRTTGIDNNFQAFKKMQNILWKQNMILFKCWHSNTCKIKDVLYPPPP